MKIFKTKLEEHYIEYNKKKWVHPDPLEFLYNYPDIKDREIVGLIASSLAYGNVKQILRSVSLVLDKLTMSPHDFLLSSDNKKIEKLFLNFKHRFTKSVELIEFLLAVREVLREFGSLEKLFLKGYDDKQKTVLPALTYFVTDLYKKMNCGKNSLVPIPDKGSACKRLNLFLRWMVRKDAVDPGGWNDVCPSKLIVPLDVHMHRISTVLKFTASKQNSMKTAVEITEHFALFCPDDPVKYDFSLTRIGIRKLEMEVADYFYCKTLKGKFNAVAT